MDLEGLVYLHFKSVKQLSVFWHMVLRLIRLTNTSGLEKLLLGHVFAYGTEADTISPMHQEAVRKDVERAFGVLHDRFAIVKNPAPFWDKVKIGKIMRACVILHNMIVEDERDGYTQYDVLDFQQGEDNGNSHVDLMYSTDIPTNIINMMGVRTRIRDRQMHQQLKADLIEHL
uniref:DDE Tnp4 domain-containing protein n=1 Tax=Brassica oleracea var. oleracea TaxID=109376 RepID=A0A0D3BGN3_BRAOL